jgi:hypothetical protein
LLVTSFGGVSYFEVFARYPSLRDLPWLNQPLVLAGPGISFLGLLRAVRTSEDYGGRVVGPVGFGVSLALATAFHWYVFDYSFGLPAPNAGSSSASSGGAPAAAVSGVRLPHRAVVA